MVNPLYILLIVQDMTWVRRVEYPMKCNWKVFVDNYLDGGYHVEHLHPALTDNLDISSYTTRVTNMYSMQEVAGVGDVRVGGHALYIYMYPSLMINRYGYNMWGMVEGNDQNQDSVLHKSLPNKTISM